MALRNPQSRKDRKWRSDVADALEKRDDQRLTKAVARFVARFEDDIIFTIADACGDAPMAPDLLDRVRDTLRNPEMLRLLVWSEHPLCMDLEAVVAHAVFVREFFIID